MLFLAPLLYKSNYGLLCPFVKIDVEKEATEREFLRECPKDASCDLKLAFDCQTFNWLVATITKGSSCSHFSGYGYEPMINKKTNSSLEN